MLSKEGGLWPPNFPRGLRIFGFSQKPTQGALDICKKQPNVLHNAARPELKVWIFFLSFSSKTIEPPMIALLYQQALC